MMMHDDSVRAKALKSINDHDDDDDDDDNDDEF